MCPFHFVPCICNYTLTLGHEVGDNLGYSGNRIGSGLAKTQ